MPNIPRIQLMLFILGYYISEEERSAGDFAESTRTAMQQFQAAIGLPTDWPVDATQTLLVIRTIQRLLSTQGATIAEEELRTGDYGESTRRLVELFRRDHQLRPAPDLNEETIDAILARYTVLSFMVSGQALRADGSPFIASGFTVQAFDALGENNHVPLANPTPLQVNGRYQITYAWRSDGPTGPNLVVRLLGPPGVKEIPPVQLGRVATSKEQLDIEVTISAPKKFTLRATVKDEATGAALPNLQVEATFRANNQPIRSELGTTNDSGMVFMTNLRHLGEKWGAHIRPPFVRCSGPRQEQPCDVARRPTLKTRTHNQSRISHAAI